MRNPALMQIGKRILQFGLPIVIVAAFVYEIRKWDWHLLLANNHQWNYWLLALAFVGYIFQELSFVFIWQNILLRLSIRLNLRLCMRIYLASEFVRYIPGNVWHILTRILWVSKYGVSRTVAFASVTIELITKLAAGAIIFALSLLFWGNFGAFGSLIHGSLFIVIGGILFIALLLVLHPRILNGLLNVALKLLKRDPVSLALRYIDILFITLNWCGSWIITGCAFFVLTKVFWPTLPLAALPICIGIYAIAWDFGFVTFITPGGLGFRELAIAALFALALPSIPGGLVAIIALIARVTSTLAELVCVGAAYGSGGRQIREVQLIETLRKPSRYAQLNKQKEQGKPISSVSQDAMVEKSAD
jgi:uncharacterized membrane protein YbhN (UPF0104 family)